MTVNDFVYTPSLGRSFRQCRRRFKFQYIDRLEPFNVQWALRFGTAWHKAMSQRFKDSVLVTPHEWETIATTTAANFQIEAESNLALIPAMHRNNEAFEEKLDEHLKLLRNMLDHYDRTWRFSGDIVSKYDIISVEATIETQLVSLPGVRIGGRLDGLLKDRESGDLYIYEHKTVGGSSSALDNWLFRTSIDPQHVHYAVLVEQKYGKPVAGVIFDLARKKVPTNAEPLKKGGVSARKDIDTTLAVYSADIVASGGDPDDPRYANVCGILAAKGNTFFKRETVSIEQWQYEDWLKDTEQVVRDIHRATEEQAFYRQSAACEIVGCPYRDVCFHDSPEARSNYRVRESGQPDLLPDASEE